MICVQRVCTSVRAYMDRHVHSYMHTHGCGGTEADVEYLPLTGSTKRADRSFTEPPAHCLAFVSVTGSGYVRLHLPAFLGPVTGSYYRDDSCWERDGQEVGTS